MRTFSTVIVTLALVAAGGVGHAGGADEQARIAGRLGSQQLGVPVQLGNIEGLRQRVGFQVLDKQYQALVRMPRVNVAYAINGTVREVRGSTGVYFSDAGRSFVVDTSAPKVLDAFGSLVLAAGTEELRVTKVNDPQVRTSDGISFTARTIKFKQYIRGRPVLLGWANIGVNEDTGEVTAFVSHFLPDRGLPREPRITSARAAESLLTGMRADTRDGSPPELSLSNASPTLAYAFKNIGDQGADAGDLVWVIDVTRRDSRGVESLQASVSATTGEVFRFESQTTSSLAISPYTAGGQPWNPFTFPQGITPLPIPLTDTHALQASGHLGTTYTAYQQTGLPLFSRTPS